MIVENEKELGEAIDKGEETIELKGRMVPRIKKIWLMDRMLWCLCLACLAVAIAALVAMPSTSGMSAAVSGSMFHGNFGCCHGGANGGCRERDCDLKEAALWL